MKIDDIRLSENEMAFVRERVSAIQAGKAAERDLMILLESVSGRSGVSGVPYRLDIAAGALRVDTYTKEQFDAKLEGKADLADIERNGFHAHPHGPDCPEH